MFPLRADSWTLRGLTPCVGSIPWPLQPFFCPGRTRLGITAPPNHSTGCFTSSAPRQLPMIKEPNGSLITPKRRLLESPSSYLFFRMSTAPPFTLPCHVLSSLCWPSSSWMAICFLCNIDIVFLSCLSCQPPCASAKRWQWYWLVLLWSFLFIPSISAVDHCCQRCFFQDWMPFGASYALLRALLLQLPLGMHHFVLDNSQQACSLFFKYSRSPLLFRGTDSKQRLYCFITKLP